MATVTITSSKNVASAIKYAGTGEVVNNYEHLDGQRVLASGGNNVDPNDAIFQMQFVQQSYGKETGYLQAYRVIQSFSTDVLDPKDKKNWELSNQLGVETAEELYPNHQTVVFTHADGDGGQLHNHIIVNAVALDGKSLSTNRRFRDVGKGSNAVLDRNGIDNLGNAYLYNFHDKKKHDKKTDAEKRIKSRPDGYSWKEELNKMIEATRQSESVLNTNDFKEHLQERYQINVVQGKRDYEYKFTDNLDKDRSITARKLNNDFKEKELEKTFNDRAKQKIQEESEEDDFLGDILGSIDSKLNSIRDTKLNNKPVQRSQAANEINERIKQRTKDEAQEKADALILAEQIESNKKAEEKRNEKELKDKKAAEEKALQEQELKIKVDSENLLIAEEQKRQDKERRSLIARIQNAGVIPNKDPVSDRKLLAFLNAEKYLQEHGKKLAVSTNKEITDFDINRRANIKIADEDRKLKRPLTKHVEQENHERELE